MKTQKTDIQEINIEFTEVKFGWLKNVIKIGGQIFNDSFSHVFDPLIHYKHWLESIAIGAQQTSFNYDNEGNQIKFDFEQVTYERCEFSIAEYFNPERIFIKATIDRQQLVKAFYISLFSFYFSKSFNSRDWEIEYMRIKIRDFLKVKEQHLNDIMLKLNRTQMLNLLHFSDSVHTNKNEDFNEQLEKDLETTLKSLESTKWKMKMLLIFGTYPRNTIFGKRKRKLNLLMNVWKSQRTVIPGLRLWTANLK